MPLLDDIKQNLPDIAKKVMLPAILAGAGTGAVSGYMSSRAHPEGEDPRQRRRRILRNAMVGTLMGGVAGATLPTGLKTLAGPLPLVGDTRNQSLTEKLFGGAISNALPLGAAAGGGLYLNRLRQKDKARALVQLLQALPEEKSVESLKNRLELQGGVSGVMRELGHATGSSGKVKNLPDWLLHHQMLSEAGHAQNLPAAVMKNNGPAIQAYIRSQSILPESLKSYGLSGLTARFADKVVPQTGGTVADAYLNYLRPGVKRMAGRSGLLGRAGLLGGGVLAANALQNAIEGK